MGNIVDILEKLKTETEIDPRSASETLEKVLSYNEKIINNNILMKKYYILSFYYWNIGDQENAKKYIDKSFSIIEYVSDSDLIIEVYIMAGNVEFLTQNSTLAFKLYLNALKLCTDKTPSSIYGRIYNNIASIFIDYGDLVRAEEFLNKALYIIDESDIYLLQIICSNIIEINIKNKNFNKTEKFLEMLERTFNIYDSIKIKNSYYLYKFLIEVNHGNYEEGLEYYEIGKKSFNYLGLNSEFINFYILSFKPLIVTGKDDLAIENLEFAKRYCESSNLYLSLRQILNELIEYYLDREEKEKCCKFLFEYYKLDSEQESNRIENIRNELETIYEKYRSQIDFEKIYDRYNELSIEKEQLLDINNNLSLINNLGIEITSTFEIEKILKKLYLNLNKFFFVEEFAIGLVEGDNLKFSLINVDGVISDYKTIPIDDKKHFSVRAVIDKKGIITNDLEITHSEIYNENKERGVIVNSLIYFPLIFQDKVIGVITIQNKEKNSFSDINIEIFKLLSSFVAISLNNAFQNQKLEEIARRDSLTEIYNRRAFEDIFLIEYNRALRNKEKVSLAIIDIDFFKEYNDTYGHIMGDECIKKIVNCIRDVLKRKTDYVGRYGGDEFIILLPDTDEKGMDHVAENILQAIRELSIEHENSEISSIVTVSIGSVSKAITSEINYDKMLNMADEALYMCKKELGRNTCYSYS